jgi:iron(III) transport system ATP-binding protein
MSTLVVEGVTKSFGQLPVLSGIDLVVEKGSTTAIVGSSGCGKTTALRIIAGFEAPDAGTVAIQDVTVSQGRRRIPAHRRGIGYVAQDGALFPHLNVRQNILFGLPLGERRSRRRAAELLEMVSLDSALAERRPDELSGGQQQRVALARALARKPKLLLLDEPFSALDASLRVGMRNAVAALLRKAGVTTVLVTHDQEEALSFADQVAVMNQGRFTQVGSPQDLYLRPVDVFTATFLGDALLLPARIDSDGLAMTALGAVPVLPRRRTGPATVMLRPEQIVASETSHDANGFVTGREFLGHDTLLRIALAPADPSAQPFTGSQETITVRQMSVTAPPPGTSVKLDLLGHAWVVEA